MTGTGGGENWKVKRRERDWNEPVIEVLWSMVVVDETDYFEQQTDLLGNFLLQTKI